MKSLSRYLMYTLALSMLVACGKENRSGRNPIDVAFNGNPYTGGMTPYAYQGVNLEQVLMQNPCITGSMGMGMVNQRTPIQVHLTNFKTNVVPGDLYVGVTSYGDVAAVVGQAVDQPPLFVAYLCPRTFTQQGTGQLMGVEIGANTPKCLFKPITRATVIFPGGASADFRWLDGGNSQRQPFAPPVCIRP